jgi:hypothetical protein
MKFLLVLLLVIVIHGTAYPRQLGLDFVDSDRIESHTLVINRALGVLHPTLIAVGFGDGTGQAHFSVGDGLMGSFTPERYSQFASLIDENSKYLEIDTDQYPELDVTEFLLDEGWRLRPVGSRPLIIKSLSTIIINGFIDCSGESGQEGGAGIAGAGGTGHCGGGDGGRGGNIGQSGENGDSASPLIGGGVGGNYTGGAAVGGGGGGAWNGSSLAGSGPNSSINGGTGGNSLSDPGFEHLFGSGGGAGGSGTDTGVGGGGGAGGGLVILSAVSDIIVGESGEIKANGGQGGSAQEDGGPGGGGGGGSIRVFSGREIQILNPDMSAAVQAILGMGGTNSLAAVGANGATGRNWFAGVTYNFVGQYIPAEEVTFIPGDVEFTSEPEFLITNSYDLQSTRWAFNQAVLDPISTDYELSVRGSSDDFVSDDTGWTDNWSAVEGKRYLRFRLTVNNSLGAQPVFLKSVTLDYSPQDLNRFDFVSPSCAIVSHHHNKGSRARALILLLPLVLLVILHVHRLRYRPSVPTN